MWLDPDPGHSRESQPGWPYRYLQAKSGELPHLLFYGPTGAGKKTRVMALLREVFGPGVERVKLEHRGFKTPTGRAVELTTIASHFHVEINPGDAGSKSFIAAAFVARLPLTLVPVQSTIATWFKKSVSAGVHYNA